MSYTKVVKKEDIENFLESVESAINEQKDDLSSQTLQFVEEFMHSFDKFVNTECPEVLVHDLEGMKDKKPFFHTSA